MRTLKSMLNKYMYTITGILIGALLIIVFIIQIFSEQQNGYRDAVRIFKQMEHLLHENEEELEETIKRHNAMCLNEASAIARLLEANPDGINDVNYLKSAANDLEILEIHIFDENGVIVAGTEPEYFGMSLDDGEQISFFKPMLYDKSLKLVQDVTPNTADGRLIQYAAVWSSDEKHIIQIGLSPDEIINATDHNELTHIFAHFRVNEEINYYAINKESGIIEGSSIEDVIGKKYNELGFNKNKMEKDRDGFHAVINGDLSYCVFTEVNDIYIGRIIPISFLYKRVPGNLLIMLLCVTGVALILAKAVTSHTNKYVVDVIKNVNNKLEDITNGDLDLVLDEETTIEFNEMSNYINNMVNSLLDNNKKMSYVLSQTNLFIGVYEYNEHTDKVRFTEYVPQILCLNEQRTEELTNSIDRFKEFLWNIKSRPVVDEEGVFIVSDDPIRYVKLEQMTNDVKVYGVIIDVTDEVLKRKRIEVERDIDQLTGLLNRRGYELKVSKLIDNGNFGISAVVMIDADGLKQINDTYGHKFGDIYLNKISEAISIFDKENSFVARLGGDEYVVFLYGYKDERQIVIDIMNLIKARSDSFVYLDEGVNVPLRFSVGYSILEDNNYNQAMKDADEKMYMDKLERKKKLL